MARFTEDRFSKNLVTEDATVYSARRRCILIAPFIGSRSLATVRDVWGRLFLKDEDGIGNLSIWAKEIDPGFLSRIETEGSMHAGRVLVAVDEDISKRHQTLIRKSIGIAAITFGANGIVG